MKLNLIQLTILLILSFGLFSCKKQSPINPIKANLSQNTLLMLEQKNKLAMNQMFSFLTFSERKNLMILKMKTILKTDSLKLNKKQKELIYYFISECKKLEETNQNSIFSQENYLKNNDTYLTLFTNKQLFLLLHTPMYHENFSLFNNENRKRMKGVDDQIEEDPFGCDCDTDSYCDDVKYPKCYRNRDICNRKTGKICITGPVLYPCIGKCGEK